MMNKRAVPRILKAGITKLGGAGIDCTVRNHSETGAALEVVNVVGIPTEFSLVIRSDNINRNCRVVWRKMNRIGVAFDPDDALVAT
jgi:hypothetical protein